MIDIEHSRDYRALAVGSAALLLLLGAATLGTQGLVVPVFGPQGSVSFESVGIPVAFCWVGVLLTALAPVVTLRSSWVGGLLATIVPLWLLWIFKVWAFTSLVGVVAVAVIVLARRPVAGVALAVVGMVFPLSLLGQATMTMPDRAVIYLHFGGPGPTLLERGVTEGLYAVGIAVVLLIGVVMRRRVLERAALSRDTAELSERARLARDLHDVVAHHVSLIAVRAETAPYTVPDLGEAGSAAMADIATEARLAMTELRGVLGVLRKADGSVQLAPQPKGTDVAALIGAATASGEVGYEGDALLAALPADQGYVAYRFVQEALTNARRHAPGARVAVVATQIHDGVRVSVSNASTATTLVPGGGLTGMRERVEAVGGELRSAVIDGHVVVEAVLPG